MKGFRGFKTVDVRGVVQDYDVTNNTYSVEARGELISLCEDMVGAAGSFFGLRFQQRIPVGTEVLLNMGSPCWIVNTGSIEYGDPEHCHGRTMLGTEIPGIVQETSGMEPSQPDAHFPSDLVEGELNWERAAGPFFRFLTGLIGLGAGDRAKIEAILCRELIRITSRNFEHFAATGDIKNFDDGGLNQEEHGTSYEHERFGLKEGEATLEDLEEPPAFDDWVNKTMRARWSKYRGFIGDLVNHWTTDPQAAAGEMAAGQFRSGKTRCHEGSDGTLLWQAVGEVIIEKTHRIPVPIRLKHEEDPKGAVRAKMKELDDKFMEAWDWSPSTPHETAFKIRDYARHVNQFQSMARFLQLADASGEFEVPSETDTPEPNTVDPDREPVAYYEAYATIRIMRDGGIMSMDAYGNVTTSGPYGMYYSSASDYSVFAARDINLKAGRSCHISGRRNVELAAHRGGLILKSRTTLRALCERGLLRLQSDYDPETPYTPDGDDPEADTHGETGILIQGAASDSVVESKKVRLQAVEDVVVAPKERLVVQAPEAELRCRTSFALHTPKVLLNVRQILGRLVSRIWFKDQLKMSGGILEAKGLVSKSIRVKGPIANTTGNVSEIDPDDIDVLVPPDDSDVPDLPDPEKDFEPSRKWDMFPAEEYAPDGDLYEPVTQQRIRLGENLMPSEADPHTYDVWPGMADALLAGADTATGTGWPGKNAKWLQYTPTRPELGVPTSQKGENFKPVSTSLTKTTISFNYQT